MDDGSVSVRDKVTGECYYVFEAPYVYDAENAEIPATVVLTPVSDGVRMHYELDGDCLLYTSVSAAWWSAYNRSRA